MFSLVNFSGVGTFYIFVRTSKLCADKLVCLFRIYNSQKHFYYDFLKTLCGPVHTSVYVPTPLKSMKQSLKCQWTLNRPTHLQTYFMPQYIFGSFHLFLTSCCIVAVHCVHILRAINVRLQLISRQSLDICQTIMATCRFHHTLLYNCDSQIIYDSQISKII